MTNLATFIDRRTMRHVRVYPHPIDRVWDAITDDAHVTAWMGFPVSFDLRVGGRCRWGPADRPYFETEIAALEPKTLVEHAAGDGGSMRFELAPHPDGTRFDFTHRFEAGSWQEDLDDLGGDLPGGPDTPWRPGFVGGFHIAFDGLGRLLDGADPADGREPKDRTFGRLVDEWLKRRVRDGEFRPDDAERYAKQLRGVAVWNEWNEIYRTHIRDAIPG